MAANVISPNIGSITIAVAAHKLYWMPSDSMYVPVHVGAAGKENIEGFARDDTGENISSLNSRYCELTALYWADRNIEADYIGLVHYRRYFAGSGDRGTMTGAEAARLLDKAPVILPKRRNYYIETLGSHYAHTHSYSHIEALVKTVNEVASGYSMELNHHLNECSGHMFNMLVMKHEILDAFCEWMFPILFAVERRIDFDGLSQFDQRLMGRLSELLVDVWIKANNIPYIEQPIVSIERTPWMRKSASFLAAKYLGKKYGKSF